MSSLHLQHGSVPEVIFHSCLVKSLIGGQLSWVTHVPKPYAHPVGGNIGCCKVMNTSLIQLTFVYECVVFSV